MKFGLGVFSGILGVFLVIFVLGLSPTNSQFPSENLVFYEGETEHYWVTIIDERRPTDRQFCSQWICLKAKFPSEDDHSPSIITSDNRSGLVKDHICVREYRPNVHGPAFGWFSNIGEEDPSMRQMSDSQLFLAREQLELAVDKVHDSRNIVPNSPANWPGMEKFEK